MKSKWLFGLGFALVCLLLIRESPTTQATQRYIHTECVDGYLFAIGVSSGYGYLSIVQVREPGMGGNPEKPVRCR